MEEYGSKIVVLFCCLNILLFVACFFLFAIWRSLMGHNLIKYKVGELLAQNKIGMESLKQKLTQVQHEIHTHGNGMGNLKGAAEDVSKELRQVAEQLKQKWQERDGR